MNRVTARRELCFHLALRPLHRVTEVGNKGDALIAATSDRKDGR